MTLLGDLDTVLDYLNKHNVPRYLDPVVARLRQHEKRMREEMAAQAAGLARTTGRGFVDIAEEYQACLDALERINGGPVKP